MGIVGVYLCLYSIIVPVLLLVCFCSFRSDSRCLCSPLPLNLCRPVFLYFCCTISVSMNLSFILCSNLRCCLPLMPVVCRAACLAACLAVSSISDKPINYYLLLHIRTSISKDQ